jgi:hypothetical protein
MLHDPWTPQNPAADKGYLFDGVLVAPEEGGAEAAEAYRLGVWRRRYWEEVGQYSTARGAGRPWRV